MPPTPHPQPPRQIAVVGGGPAGLRAAEVAAQAGAEVTLFEAGRSAGRKFLVAGKSGLNLTNSEPLPALATRYHGGGDWPRWLADFSNTDTRVWAAGLGIDTFESGGGGKVFPEGMKAAPLLRRWVTRLRTLGVTFHVRHRCSGLARDGDQTRLRFETAEGEVEHTADAVVLALGGASWPQTGSDGAWTGLLQDHGTALTEFAPANCGWEVDWPPAARAAEGLPLKNIVARAGHASAAGELVITRYGLEGAPIYHLGPALRAMADPVLHIDLKPTFTAEQLAAKLDGVTKDRTRAARRRWRLDRAASALLGAGGDAGEIAARAKSCPVPLLRPRPIAEAISTAGGVACEQLTSDLMIKHLPGVFIAGEMLDWEAPTGGFLLQGCLTTGHRAGRAAAAWR